MRPRAPWLVLGSAAWLAACGLSTQGSSIGDLGYSHDSGNTADAADIGDGSMQAPPDSGGMQHPMDASMHKSDGAPDATHGSGPEAGSGDDGPAGTDAQDGTSGSESGGGDDGPSDTGTLGNDTGTQDGPCDGAPGCVSVPLGWSLVAFAPDQTTGCPAGFTTPTNLVESPNAASACTCGSCGVTGQPSCASGTVGVYYDYVGLGAGACGTPGMVPQLNNDPAGACGSGSDVYHGDYSRFDVAYVPPPSTGGSCSAPGSGSGKVTYGARDRTCVPSSAQSAGCYGSLCAPSLSSPYSACIMQSGTTTCPPGPLGVLHLAGTGASFGCSDCSCSVSATCTGSITLYTDSKCTKPGVTIPANGSCNRISSLPNSANTTTFGAYIYTPDPPASVQCTASGSSSAENVALQNTVTICCAQ